VTDLAFHFGAADKPHYACRLLRKAAATGAKVVLLANADMVAKIDADLWAISPTDFVAHCLGTAESTVQVRSGLVLVSDLAQVKMARQILVNLSDAVPDGFEQFDRLIEVVSTHAQDREAARSRWRYYASIGYPITRHDLTQQTSTE